MDPMKVKIKGSKKLAAGRWLNLFDVNYTARTGEEKSWQVVTRQKEPRGSPAARSARGAFACPRNRK